MAGVESTARQLPDSFCVSYSNSQGSNAKLRIALQRHLDTELLDSQRIRAAAARTQAAGSTSAAATAAMAEASSDAWRMSNGAALAQGRPLMLSLSVPVWVINGTQLPIAVGIVQQSTLVATEGGGLSGSGEASEALGSTTAGQLRVVDTEAYTQVTRPNSHVSIMGNSVEMLSFPGEGPDGSAPNSSSSSALRGLEQQTALASGVVQQWAAVISVMGSRWSSPLVLATASADAATGATQPGESAPVAEAVARLPRYEPVLIRAKCKDGCVYEIAVRVESAGRGLPLSTVVRLDPHIVVSNRTGYTLHMVQPEPIWRALGSSMVGPVGGVVSASSRSSLNSPAAWIQSSPALGPLAQRGPPSAASSTPVRDSTLVLRAGSLAVPLSWPQGCARRMLLLSLPPSPAVHGAAAAAAVTSEALAGMDHVMWSEPFRIDYPATGLMQVLLPLYRLGTTAEPQAVNEEHVAAAYGAFNTLFQQHAQHQQGQPDGPNSATPAAARPPLVPGRQSTTSTRSSIAAAADSAATKPLLVHMVRRIDGGLQEYLAVTVNLAVEMSAPGCMHVILQSLGGEPQQCLMNCTQFPISYRQATPKAAWQELPPYSGAALVLLQPAGGGVAGLLSGSGDDPSSLMPNAEVELRDAHAATSGSAVCSLDTDSSGLATSQAAGRSGTDSAAARRADSPATFAIAKGKTQALAQVCAAGWPVPRQAMACNCFWSKQPIGGLLGWLCCSCEAVLLPLFAHAQFPTYYWLSCSRAPHCPALLLAAPVQVLPLLESTMAPAGPAEVPGAGGVSVGRTQTDRLLRVLPKPSSVSMNQLRLAACIAGQDQVRQLLLGSKTWSCIQHLLFVSVWPGCCCAVLQSDTP